MAKRRGGRGRTGKGAASSGGSRGNVQARTGKRRGRQAGGRSGSKAGRQRGGPGGPLSRRAFVKAGLAAAGVVLVGGGIDRTAAQLNTFGGYGADRLAALRAGASTHLLDRYPGLRVHAPWRPLGAVTTPVQELPSLPGASDVRLFVKRDDLSSGVYGGNKVRKLEHYLAHAALAGRKTLITLGGIGTNHGLATTLFGTSLGFRARIAMFDQPVTAEVRQNLRAFAATSAELHYAGSPLRAALLARELYGQSAEAGEAPYFVPAGGSTRLGSLGYVNAGLELAEQVRAGIVPEPDRIFVALGSCGTAAGLAVGCRLGGLRTRVSAVRVSSRAVANGMVLRWMANDLAMWLREADRTVPRVRLGFGDVDVIGDQLGDGYGHPSDAGMAAASWAEGRFTLEPTYTAKALAACLAHCRGSARPGETVLFWNTVNAAPLQLAPNLDGLPAAMRERVRLTR